jgi:hypothetical protein
VPLLLVQATHLRVVCDSCRTANAEVCGKRDAPAAARIAAIRKLKDHGWHHDAGEHTRVKTLEHVERDGSGRWYCPACASRSHL